MLLVVAALILSFKPYNWKDDKKSRDKIHQSITTLFNRDTFILEDISIPFYSIFDEGKVIGYLCVSSAQSKNQTFDYYIIYNLDSEILKVEILNYREDHGFEICNKRWLKQFIGFSTNSYFDFNSKIDGISGATISVNSLKTDVFYKTSDLKELIK